MPTEADLVMALRRADAAGDQAGATRIAQIINAQRAAARPGYTAGQKAADPVTGYLTTAARAVPGLTELGAGYSAALRTAGDAIAGRPLDFGARFNEARSEQQGAVDQFGHDRPIASASATALGTVLPATVLGGVSVARSGAELAAAGAKAGARTLGATTRKVIATGARNAMTGGAMAGVYGAAQPGTLDQRARSAAAAIPSGAVMGAALPAAGSALLAARRRLQNAFEGAGARAQNATTDTFGAESNTPIQGTPDDLLHTSPDTPAPQQQSNVIPFVRPDTVSYSTVRPPYNRSGTASASGLGNFSPEYSSVAGERARWLIDTIEKATGLDRSEIFGNIESLMINSRKSHASLLSTLYKFSPRWTPQLIDKLDSGNIRPHRANASQLVEASGYDPELYTGRQDDDDIDSKPSSRTIDMTMQIIDHDLFKNWDPETGSINDDPDARSLRNDLQNIHHLLYTDTGPFGEAYRNAINSIGNRASIATTLSQSRGRILDQGESSSDFSAWFSKLRPFERRAAQSAAARDIYAFMHRADSNVDAFQSYNIQDKLDILFGDIKRTNLINQLITGNNNTVKFKINPYDAANPGGSDAINLHLSEPIPWQRPYDIAQNKINSPDTISATPDTRMNALEPSPEFDTPSFLGPWLGAMFVRPSQQQNPDQE